MKPPQMPAKIVAQTTGSELFQAVAGLAAYASRGVDLEIAWKVPLGSYDEMEAQGVKNAGTPNLGGSIATAGGLVFIGATLDARFRAFDARTGKELWSTRLDAAAITVPMTYEGRDGKQYVVVAAGGPARFRSIDPTKSEGADSLIAFALP